MIETQKMNFKSWASLTKYIDDTFTYFNDFKFRGQADSQWKLESTLTRALKDISGEEQKSKIAKNHLEAFKSNLRGRCGLNLKEISENELYAIGQHYGLYTPLLDFTLSPYVGLFFALQGSSKSKERCLWAISNSFIKDINALNNEASAILEYVNPLTNDNQRLISQQGLFYRLPIGANIEELAKKANPTGKGVPFFKLIFPDKLCKDFLARLNNMNINNLTLYPDISGSALHTNYIMDVAPLLKNRVKEIWQEYDKRTKNITQKEKEG